MSLTKILFIILFTLISIVVAYVTIIYIYELAEYRECGWNPIKLIASKGNECWCLNGTMPNGFYGGFGCDDYCYKFCNGKLWWQQEEINNG